MPGQKSYLFAAVAVQIFKKEEQVLYEGIKNSLIFVLNIIVSKGGLGGLVV